MLHSMGFHFSFSLRFGGTPWCHYTMVCSIDPWFFTEPLVFTPLWVQVIQVKIWCSVLSPTGRPVFPYRVVNINQFVHVFELECLTDICWFTAPCMALKNELDEWISYYWHLEFLDTKMADHSLNHFNCDVYGLRHFARHVPIAEQLIFIVQLQSNICPKNQESFRPQRNHPASCYIRNHHADLWGSLQLISNNGSTLNGDSYLTRILHSGFWVRLFIIPHDKTKD